MRFGYPITGAERINLVKVTQVLGEFASKAYCLQTELSLQTNPWTLLNGHIHSFHEQYGERVPVDTEEKWRDFRQHMFENSQLEKLPLP